MKGRRLLIAAPHFDHPLHLGGIRVERFRKWAAAEGIEITIVRAAGSAAIREESWGRVLSIPEPLGFYPDPPSSQEQGLRPPPPRKSNRLRRIIAYLLLVPDPIVLWNRRVLRSAQLRELCREPDWILASSPPESSLVLASQLARRHNARLLLDFRDGWLDESMIPLLAASRIQRQRHARMEAKVVRLANAISLSSEIWKKMLERRYPEASGKTIVLSNNCPSIDALPPETSRDPGRPLTLLYAGKIHSSRPERKTRDLLEPLLEHLPPGAGKIVFRGNLGGIEIRELEARRGEFSSIGWKLEMLPPLALEELRKEISRADGLLMLSTSRASIPAKLFDYLPSGRPVLAVTVRDSILDRLQPEIPQLFLHHGLTDNVIGDFLRACREGCRAAIPQRFTEAFARGTFLQLLRSSG